jgi:excisionase family DNA binding protein
VNDRPAGRYLLKSSEAAERLGFASAQTFLRWARRTGFPLIRLSPNTVRVRKSDVEKYLGTYAD